MSRDRLSDWSLKDSELSAESITLHAAWETVFSLPIKLIFHAQLLRSQRPLQYAAAAAGTKNSEIIFKLPVHQVFNEVKVKH